MIIGTIPHCPFLELGSTTAPWLHCCQQYNTFDLVGMNRFDLCGLVLCCVALATVLHLVPPESCCLANEERNETTGA